MPHAITVTGLSKRYRLHHVGRPRYRSIREDVSFGVEALLKRLLSTHPQRERDSDEEFWALKDVSFTVAPGERLGVIGRNGAGKSTLLKVLSRITEPTDGRIELRGRVSSLLEVGTGFHPELTGRENIFLNGAILGMTTREIRRKFDEIVAFAEIERFLDTPVKRYSSGMYVRLAFSVAAHLEPDILIVDEVLAVGDAQFQRKCLGKMEEVNREGRTVIFVSHNMTTITSLCTRCLLLNQGRIQSIGAPTEVTANYYRSGFSGSGTDFTPTEHTARSRDDVAILRRARLVDSNREPIDYARIDQKLGVEMYYDILQNGCRPIPNIHVFAQGQYAFISSPSEAGPMPKGSYVSVMWIPANFLNEGVYVAGIALSSMNPVRVHFYVPDGIIFNVVDDITDPARHDYTQPIPGIIRPRLEWITAPHQALEHA